ncbi:MAG: hypothetical protein LBH20_05480 [Treponema sp.]|nr:hypothetical protein [Treponema sp.]
MKKLIVAAVFAAFLVIGSPIFAQDSQKDKDSEYYYKNVSLEKIYPYRNGYVVQYRRGISMDKVYLPMSWFSSSAGKGEIVTLPQGKAWPSLSVYYKNGEFSHVRLYVHHLPSHQTWGVIPQNVNLDSSFENIEDLRLKF